MTDEPLPDALAAAVLRVDALVRHFEEHPDPAVRDEVVELLQQVDGLHRGGLRRLASLLRAAGLERRALDDAEVRLLYTLYDLEERSASESDPAAAVPGGSFVPLANLVGESRSRG